MRQIKLIDMKLVDACRHDHCDVTPTVCPRCESEKMQIEDELIFCPCCLFEGSLAGWQAKKSSTNDDINS